METTEGSVVSFFAKKEALFGTFFVVLEECGASRKILAFSNWLCYNYNDVDSGLVCFLGGS